MNRRQKTTDRSFGGTITRWVKRGLRAVAAAKGIYDTARALYSVGQAIAPYAGAAAMALV
ncbi:MAG: hypothetical protein EBV06_17460 [Planctomycetia bacterium]|nr:hypothetical protein [Planctomycetia bacterium]